MYSLTIARCSTSDWRPEQGGLGKIAVEYWMNLWIRKAISTDFSSILTDDAVVGRADVAT